MPNKLGLYIQERINIKQIIPFIDWTFFFTAWRLTGHFEGIEQACDCVSCKTRWLQKFKIEDRPKAEEAIKLYKDATELLRTIKDEKQATINACYGIFEASAHNEDIFIKYDNRTIHIPVLRQQHPSTDGFCYALSDFIGSNNDYIGCFATTVLGMEDLAKQYEKDNDVYGSILVKTLADRLAEATAEWLHWKIRTEYWGYAPSENLSIREMLKARYSGIRPAIGYPSLPDQSIIFRIGQLIDFQKIGITLTENGAMYPNASVCGLYFAHPKSKYFMIGKIDEHQLADYAHRCNTTTENTKKWLAANL